MDSKTRFTTFGIGALVGVLVLWGLNQKADPARERRRQVMTSLSLPGMYYDCAVQGEPLFGHFILAERRTPLPEGGLRRELITGGRNRFDTEGRPQPNDLLLVTEDYAPGVEPSEKAKVAAVRFAFADRAEVVLVPGAGSLPLDARVELSTSESAPSAATLRLRDVASAKGEALFALVDYVRANDGKLPVASARLAPIDWQAEAELIRRVSGQ